VLPVSCGPNAVYGEYEADIITGRVDPRVTCPFLLAEPYRTAAGRTDGRSIEPTRLRD